MFLSPNVPYHPPDGLVALFAKTGTHTQNPRAPHVSFHSYAASALTYADVAKFAMDGNGAGQRGGGNQRGGGRGVGQSGFIGRVSFQAANQAFHPGYGGRAAYTGRGAGRFGGGHGRSQGRFFGGRGNNGGGRQGGHNDAIIPPAPTPAPAPEHAPPPAPTQPAAGEAGAGEPGLGMVQLSA